VSDPRGPYVSENGDEVYLPVEGYTIAQARHAAASYAEEAIGSWGRARYTGRRSIPLHDCGDEWYSCEVCPPEPTWTFETYEGSYRR
jgi:hypothetical protein